MSTLLLYSPLLQLVSNDSGTPTARFRGGKEDGYVFFIIFRILLEGIFPGVNSKDGW
jgi:hypothetical protein